MPTPQDGGNASTKNLTRKSRASPPSFERSCPKASWHAHSVTEVAEKLRSDPARGLAELKASRRLAEFGPNRLAESHGRTAFAILRAVQKRDRPLTARRRGDRPRDRRDVEAVAILIVIVLNALSAS